MSAGYSGTPLVKKLGLKPGITAAIINPPADYEATLGPLPKEIHLTDDPVERLDFCQLFCTWRSELQQHLLPLKARLNPAGMLWISWPKKAARVPGDLDENVIRVSGLSAGLVDVKVCAVDEVWSALKFVYRLQDRPKKK